MRVTTSRLLAFGVFIGLAAAGEARAQYSFAPDPPGVNPALGNGPMGYSGFGYSARGPRGVGYYTGLYVPPYDGGPSEAYNPIFSALNAAPQSVAIPAQEMAAGTRPRGPRHLRWFLRSW